MFYAVFNTCDIIEWDNKADINPAALYIDSVTIIV